MSLDVIGDVHGQHAKLVALLVKLGYRDTGGAWRHPGRTAIFVGDLIDRGPGQLETVDVVRRMIDAGTARSAMGNHEFNAIAWTMPDPDNPGDFLRSHREPGNRHHHQAFLARVEGTRRHAELVDWFKTLPLWLDLGGIRVVHACWHQASIDALAPFLGPQQTLTDELMLWGSRPRHWAHSAIETLCKGPEVPLAGGLTFEDKEGKIRSSVRVRWWERDVSTYRKAAIGPPVDVSMIPDGPMPTDWRPNDYVGVPVVFGHYWFSGVPNVISRQFACVDYSAAKDGPLVAYRWDGEPGLKSDKLTWVTGQP